MVKGGGHSYQGTSNAPDSLLIWTRHMHEIAMAPPEAIAAAKSTAMNPAVLTAFALAISADGQRPAYPGIPGHEPSVKEGRKAAERIDRCMSQLRALVADPGSYVSESNYFEKRWQQSY